MALVQKDLFNSPYAGVFCATNDNLTLVPPGIPTDDMEAISEALGTKLEIITLGGSRVLGTIRVSKDKSKLKRLRYLIPSSLFWNCSLCLGQNRV